MKTIKIELVLIISAGVVLLVGLATVSCGCSNSWEVQTQSDSLHAVAYTDVFFFDKNLGLAAGLGEIKKTNNGGISWFRSSIPDTIAVTSFRIENQRIWAVGSNIQRPTIIYSDDRGDSWHAANIMSSAELSWNDGWSIFYDISFDSQGQAWIAGNMGVLEAKFSGNEFDVVSIYKSEWPIYSLAVTNENGGVVGVGGHGSFFYSTPTATMASIDKTDNLVRVRIFGREIWIAGSYQGRGVLYCSHDGGKSWEPKISTDETNILYDVFLSKGQGWLIGANGLIFKTADYGKSWSKDNSPTKVDLQRIFYLDSDNVWISGDKLTILRKI